MGSSSKSTHTPFRGKLLLSKNQCRHEGSQRKGYLFGDYCEECGMGVGYADDILFNITGRDVEEHIWGCNIVL